MNTRKDGGDGITARSLAFWRANKAGIGPVLSIEVRDDLLVETSPDGYPVEYPCVITGTDGSICLSGCTCGYGGEGPNGTRMILVDLGVPPKEAQKMMLQESICYHTPERRLV
jgi:hypothetical protein